MRAALRAAAPDLADLPIALEGTPDLSNPIWASGRATVGERVFAKFAFSERTAVRIWREAQALDLLGNELGLAVPKLMAASPNPAFSATELVSGGAPLSYKIVAAAAPDRIEQLAAQLAGFLSQLHAPETLARVRERLDSLPRLPEKGLHVSTDQLRARFTSMIEPHQRSMVIRWCDWVDNQLASPAKPSLSMATFTPTTSCGISTSRVSWQSWTSRPADSASPSLTSAYFPPSGLGLTCSCRR